jgi:hypothetical protein
VDILTFLSPVARISPITQGLGTIPGGIGSGSVEAVALNESGRPGKAGLAGVATAVAVEIKATVPDEIVWDADADDSKAAASTHKMRLFTGNISISNRLDARRKRGIIPSP